MKLNPRLLLIAVTAVFFGVGGASAQTVISGPNIMTSTWTPLGSPYIITADCTVPPGQNLTILPGTTVWMASGTSLTGNGVIYAVGTAVQPIVFEPPVPSQMWNTIIMNNTVGTNQFKYCEFANATNALDFRGASKNAISDCTFSNVSTGIVFRDNSINSTSFCTFQNLVNGVWMTVGANNRTQTSAILNCAFTNCYSIGVYGEAYGNSALVYPVDSWFQHAWIKLTVKNCTFSASGGGLRLNAWGVHNQDWYAAVTGSGYGDLKLINNVFNSITNTAIWLSTGNYAGGGPATLVNNTVAGAHHGVLLQDPWDAKIQNNILRGCSMAVTRTGTLSASASYNDFYGNATNFTGYPATYGQILIANRNGTPSDILYNIFSDPMLTAETDSHLQAGSPCIDAGEGSGANFDSYFPPSMGSVTNDIGAYGGPSAGQWIVPAGTNAFTLGITEIPHASVTVNPPSPGHYRLEYSSALLGTNTWIQITNLPLTTVPFIYTEPAVSPARFYRAVKQ